MRDKKAQVSTLVWIIFAICVILLLVWFIFVKVSPETSRAVNLDACRSTVRTASAMREKTSIIPPIKLNCPAFESEFDVKEEGKRVAVMRIATELKNCWYKTYGGKNRLGKSHGGFLFWESDWISPDPNICIVCSTFNVTDNISTKKVTDYIKEKNLFTTSWPEHYFVKPREVESLSSLSKVASDAAAGGGITICPKNDWFIRDIEHLEPGKIYYVIDLHAPTVKRDDYVHVFVVDEDDLGKVRCDIFFHEMIKD